MWLKSINRKIKNRYYTYQITKNIYKKRKINEKSHKYILKMLKLWEV